MFVFWLKNQVLHISCLFSALVFLWNFLESFFVSSFDPSKNTWNWCIQSTKQITNPNRFGSRFRFQKETSKRLWLHCYHLQKLLYFYKVKAIIYDLIKNHVRGPSQTMLTRFWLFLTTNTPSIDIFCGMNVDKEQIFLDNLPTLSCKRSLWMTPIPCTVIWRDMGVDWNGIYWQSHCP